MARLSLEDLIAEVLSQSDMAAATATREAFVSQADIIRKINLELSELYDLLVTTWADYAIRHPAPTITTVADQDHYLLPDGFFKLRGLWEVDGSSRLPVPAIPFHRLHWGSAPGAGRILEIHMVPEFTPLVDLREEVNWGTDFSLPWGWEDMVIQGAAARILEKEESDPTPALTRKAQVRARILSAAPTRDESAPEQIIDVQRDLDRLLLDSSCTDELESTLRYCISGRLIYIREE